MEYKSKTTVASILDDIEYIRKRKNLRHIALVLGSLSSLGFISFNIDKLNIMSIKQFLGFTLEAYLIGCVVILISLALGYMTYLKD